MNAINCLTRLVPITALAALVVLLGNASVNAADEAHEVTVAEGRLVMKAPGEWEKKEPRVRFIEYEFEAPAADKDSNAARITVMGAGGSVKANIDRWMGQFTQPDGKSTKQVAKVEEKEIAGQNVHLIDITGTYRDQAGPFFGKVVEREDYRMLGAIIVTEKWGQYYVKMYGPRATMDKHAKDFHQMVQSLSVQNK